MNRQSIIRGFDIFSAGLSYFKLGYGGYLTFIVGLGGAVSSVYYLTILQTPWAKSLFPTFAAFLLPALLAGVPLSILLGYFEQNSSLRRGQIRVDPFQRALFEYIRLSARKDGWDELADQVDFLLKGKKNKP